MTHIIKAQNKPVAVIIDYEEYQRIMDYLEDKIDLETMEREKKHKKEFITLEEYENELQALNND